MAQKFSLLFFFIGSFCVLAQGNQSYWQQHVDYTMEVEMNTKNFQYSGTQELVYTNHSPDTLKQVFYHLFYNAFQPGSEMDVRSRTIADPDARVADRISKLKEDEIGYLKLKNIRQDGKAIEGKTIGTVYQLPLEKPLLPGEQTILQLDFEGQVPLQIRRAGRDNAEGIALSVSQWYPKLAEYDYEGWHADPYIAREFHGVWGNFDVKITIDKDYVVGGTGYLQNPEEIGHGYQKDLNKKVKHKGKKLTWHFVAPKVHDFMWAADPDYIHDRRTTADGKTTMHFLYKNKKSVIENWKKLQEDALKLYDFFSEQVGPYPYDQYSIIQGGDGGMEYAMATLINGDKKYGSVLGTTAHEFAHSWFHMILATNENTHPWMDEGFTSYISMKAMNELFEKEPQDHFLKGYYQAYIRNANSGNEQPETTHSDRYATNASYSVNAYVKGAIFLEQLGYLIGEDNLSKTLHRYYDEWKFKHPTPNDFIRVAEKVSGAELQWYLTDWIGTTNTIDYGIKSVETQGNQTEITLERIGLMPMPLEVKVDYTDGTSEKLYIPLRMMYGAKPNAGKVQTDWPWTNPTYQLTLNKPKDSIQQIEIDPSQRMADVDRSNNMR